MRPEQIQVAAAEVLTQIAGTTKPANEVLNAYTRARRYIGSKDRRHLGELVWGVLRQRARLQYVYPDWQWAEFVAFVESGAELVLPENTPVAVRYEVPEWLVNHIENADVQLPALLESAPIVLRANGNRDKIRERLLAEGIETEPTKLSPFGLILQKRCNLNASACYKTGAVEVQDEGSQLVALETGITAGNTVLDYCAGAGGKSLIFAQMMNGKGQIVAHDISVRSLQELEKRAERAKVHIIETKEKITQSDYPQGFKHVVVDAPCSGTGTWRRCPDARWKLTQAQLSELVQKQKAILDEASQFVEEQGFLHYMTCSLTTDENTGQVADFIARHSDFVLVKSKQFSPANSGTDGLFVATLCRQ